ncbi:MAG: N-acetyl-gamma-glutamyl-phosphate reductase [Ruminococcaceae bacterium]|nr:N-acetyl-gamma-glutamyl-phosphate reductase [Oscillospiraceae bacterium]
MTKVFIDGKAGTTGLRIYERLAGRDDVSLVLLSDDERKDASARKKALNECDIAFLCLPDDAAREAVSMIENPDVVVIDASTAHRTVEGWAYGFPELSPEFEQRLKKSKRIANPGCHASGFIALVYPLVEAGILPADALLSCHSITGYSGGGKKMIADYDDENRNCLLDYPRQYGITQNHKHLKEMKHVTGIENAPVFSPIVSDFYSGMEVTVPLFAKNLNAGYTVENVRAVLKSKYNGNIVKYVESADDAGFLSAGVVAQKDTMLITVCGNEDRFVLVALYDNLGKGASGAAVECMNIVMGVSPEKGLVI